MSEGDTLTGRRRATVAEAMGRLPGPGGERFAEVLAHGSMEVEIYAPRGTDPQTPHTRDEVYVVVSGNGTFVNGPERHPFGPGDVLFVPAGVEHRFEDFTDDLAVWVVFYGPEGGRSRMTMRLHDYLPSGNGYKVRLLMTQLGVPFERIEYDITKGETRTPEFLENVNANGRIPVLEAETGEFLPESNAILFYLAESTPFLPDDRFDRAQALRWMFFEQYNHEPNIAVARAWLHVFDTEMTEERRGALEVKRELGYDALDVMEEHLQGRQFFVGGRYSVADIALYAYTHVADEGGFDLEGFPAVRAWLERVSSQPGYIPITQG